jgi:hypothetical protein
VEPQIELMTQNLDVPPSRSQNLLDRQDFAVERNKFTDLEDIEFIPIAASSQLKQHRLPY